MKHRAYLISIDLKFSRAVYESQTKNWSYEMNIFQGELTLPAHELYSNEDYRNLLRNFILQIVFLLQDEKKLYPNDINVLKSQVDDIVEFEHFLARDLNKAKKHMATVVPLKLKDADEIAKLTPTWGTWADFLNDLISVSGPTIGKYIIKRIKKTL